MTYENYIKNNTKIFSLYHYPFNASCSSSCHEKFHKYSMGTFLTPHKPSMDRKFLP